MEKGTEEMLDIVDFVEEHGGSMGGETRDRLVSLVQAYTTAMVSNILDRCL